ncbi:MAG: Metallo-beta-lactamase superfamily protein [Candidatus Accumulibacter adjunctus]|uniref:Linear primary-alkylsulfatase n=1 Tax=Candidatus Accumulibacter adjunctus TaxID=1454001 RepID=A0A011NWQ9_9PROT|nr:MAG: Metallo-beta-lactamase superfamily protein [Candidatus Accumulibacter adjunctus]
MTIKDAKGNVVWDLEQYKKYIGLDKTAPDTVNPSLWRNAQLSLLNGLFKVTDRIYQVRGYDLSNISFVQGDTGWIVFDPLISPETARAGLELINRQLGRRPVVAVVYSHSHVDHYGGVRGIVDAAEVAAGKVQILAPEHFTEHAVSENVIAGNAMARRAVYMYGALLPRNARGGVNGGLGMTTSTGLAGLILPTREIRKTGEEVTIDGVRMVFQMTPGTEAPAEMNTWFPQFKALWMAENATNTMHNILTLRGAQVRDALKWAGYLNETIETWGGDVEVKFQSHHWPRWGNANVVDYFKKQRDLYKYTHDQSVRLMNQGYTGEEISEMIKLPAELDNFWPNRGYYGTLRHNSRAVYQRYMGWYNGNPSNLNNLPPEMVGPKYVEFMGGEAALLKKARASFDKGEYRWVAEVLKHAVFANPKNAEARELLADTLEQLGYQAESGPWRSVYLQGAYELRNGVPSAGGTQTATPDTIRAMSPAMLFDYLAVRLNAGKAAGKKYAINIDFPDLQQAYTLSVENAVLNHTRKQWPQADVSLSMDKATLNAIQLKETSLEKAVADGKLKITGNAAVFEDFMASLDSFDFWFNIVTP